MPELVFSIRELREKLLLHRRTGKTIGFVPTMGALHAGHRRLLEIARQENDVVVASIFVNPLQFDRSEDLERYPRTLDQDFVSCADAGVDFIFAPSPAEMYPQETLIAVDVRSLTDTLCGPFRPGHFHGVATVVLKLFLIVCPDRAYFGEKDAQQLAVIRRVVEELNVPVEIVPVATVREPDGLALSSRNQLLTVDQRRIAPVLWQALLSAREFVVKGESSVEAVLKLVEPIFAGCSDIRLEYFEIVDPKTLAPVPQITGTVLIAGAMWVGSIRLIDNVIAAPQHISAPEIRPS